MMYRVVLVRLMRHEVDVPPAEVKYKLEPFPSCFQRVGRDESLPFTVCHARVLRTPPTKTQDKVDSEPK